MRRRGIAILLVAGMGAFVWVLREGSFSRAQDCGPTTLSRDSSVFTPAHKSMLDAVKEFFDWRTLAVQPIAFTHKVHLGKGLQCTDCHTSVEQGPRAGIPGVQLCMTCHQAMATDRPEIKRVAQSCAQQRITLRFVSGIIASRQFTQPLRQYIFQKHITILKHTSR